jgi:hypothetical protein
METRTIKYNVYFTSKLVGIKGGNKLPSYKNDCKESFEFEITRVNCIYIYFCYIATVSFNGRGNQSAETTMSLTNFITK